MAGHTGLWGRLLGARIQGVEADPRGNTRISVSSPEDAWTVVVDRTQAVWSSLTSTPSGALRAVTPVFTDGGALVSLVTEGGEELLVAGGGAWIS